MGGVWFDSFIPHIIITREKTFLLKLTQLLSLEISTSCNLSYNHCHHCPVAHIKRDRSRSLTDDLIFEIVRSAYLELEFSGFVSWGFYNEPMLEWPRMLYLTQKIKDEIPQSKFFLWTNGTVRVKDDRMKLFNRTYISNYDKLPHAHYLPYFYNCYERVGGGQPLDNRLEIYKNETENDVRCLAPFSDFIINNSGDVHICCLDWNNEIKIGNAFDYSLKELDELRTDYIKKISGAKMLESAHKVCKSCPYKWDIAAMNLQLRDRAVEYANTLPC